MTSSEITPPQSKCCPACGLSIPEQATRCPECHSDIAFESAGVRRRKSFTRVAEAIRDWIGFPAAVIAAVLAFYTPAATTVSRWLGQDGAVLAATLFNTDVINVGHDDTPALQRVDKITQYESILRGSLINDGYSAASVGSNFICTGPLNEDGTRTIFTFDFFDPQSQTKQFPSVEARSSIQFFARLDHAMPYTEQEFTTARPMSCQFGYFDKYGGVSALIIDMTGDQLRSISSLVNEDQTSEQRSRFCGTAISGFGLGGDIVADCVTGSHVSIIEPSYLWQRALSRALASTATYNRQLSPPTPARPGVILLCNPDASNCDADTEAFRLVAKTLSVPLTAWLCPPDSENIGGCKREDFATP